MQIALGLLLIVIVDAVVSTLQTGSPAPVLMIPIAAILGPIVGLGSDAACFTTVFKLELLLTLAVAAALSVGGWLHRGRVLARIAVVLGVVLWVFAGFVGFGPQ